MKRQLLIFILLAFLVGAAGSIFFNRVVFPKLASVQGFSWVSKLSSNAPIIITRREEVRLNEGVNLIELTKQSQTVTVSIFMEVEGKFLGNGIILTSDGTILTTKDVVGANSVVSVVTNDGTVLEGTVRATDPKSPLAVISVPGKDMPVAQFSDAGLMQTAQRIIALGRTSEEFTRQFASGMVTKTLSNAIDTKVMNADAFEEVISTDAKLDSNFIGGPVVNLQGLVIGMVVDGTGRILPAEYMDGAIKSYLASGKVTRPFFDFKYSMLTKSRAKIMGLGEANAKVAEVPAGGPADKAGLNVGDYITRVNGQDMATTSFEQLLASQGTNEVKLSVTRGSENLELTIKPEIR